MKDRINLQALLSQGAIGVNKSLLSLCFASASLSHSQLMEQTDDCLAQQGVAADAVPARLSASVRKNGDEAMRQVVIYPGEDGYWVAECPSLLGCISQGKTKQEAISNIKEAIERYIISLSKETTTMKKPIYKGER